jgi:hypothetical protein
MEERIRGRERWEGERLLSCVEKCYWIYCIILKTARVADFKTMFLIFWHIDCLY